MKIVFMGTPDFAVPALRELVKKHEVICVYTQPPKEAGRGQKVTKTPIHLFAESKGIEVRHPVSLKSLEEQQKFAELQADISVVAAYGLILPSAVIDAFPKGCINIHGSLLPRWRGAAPIQRSIETGDKKTGITIMNVVLELDAGDMLIKGEIKIDENTTGGSLHDEMSELGAELIVEYLDNIDSIIPKKQDETLVTYAKKLDKTESKLDFNDKAEMIERKIRAFNPYPATYFEYKNERFKILKVKIVDKKLIVGEIKQEEDRLYIGCQDKSLEILELQRAGKKAMSIKELLNGFSFA